MRALAYVSAQRPMKDSVNWQDIPVGTPIVAGYVPPSSFAWPPEAWARFAGSIEVRITPSVSVWGPGIQVLDVEPGDASASQVPGWVVNSRNSGQEPTVYTSESNWANVINACYNAGVAMPEFWIADWNDVPDLPSITVGVVTATAVAHQYAGSATSGGNYDLSTVADYWPGVDGADMQLSDEIVIPNGPNAGKVLADVNDTMYFTDLYAGQAATVVQDPNVGNAALAAQLKTLATKLDAVIGRYSATDVALLDAVQANARSVDTKTIAPGLEQAGLPAALVNALLAAINAAITPPVG
jgi:hypothetical protein